MNAEQRIHEPKSGQETVKRIIYKKRNPVGTGVRTAVNGERKGGGEVQRNAILGDVDWVRVEEGSNLGVYSLSELNPVVHEVDIEANNVGAIELLGVELELTWGKKGKRVVKRKKEKETKRR